MIITYRPADTTGHPFRPARLAIGRFTITRLAKYSLWIAIPRHAWTITRHGIKRAH